VSCPSGLTCRQLALDPGYLAAMQKRLPANRFQLLFGQLSSSSFCAKP